MKGGERRLTDSLAAFFPSDRERVPLGIGDDAAVVRHARREGVVACDPVVEGVHFAPGTPPGLVGRKAVNRNLSDIAAMGAVPDHLLVSVLLPAAMTAAARRALFGGIRRAATCAGALVVGGDVGCTPGPLTVTVTVLGHAPGRVLTRRAARLGDALHVTGPLGGAGIGSRHLQFEPRLAEGRWLARQPAVHAAIDVSDGLLLDLWTMLGASGLRGAVLFEDAVPIASAARRGGGGALRRALTEGEDHELLFAVARGRDLPAGGPLCAAARRPIGVVADRPGLWLRASSGDLHPVQPTGYQHDVD